MEHDENLEKEANKEKGKEMLKDIENIFLGFDDQPEKIIEEFNEDDGFLKKFGIKRKYGDAVFTEFGKEISAERIKRISDFIAENSKQYSDRSEVQLA